MGMTESIGLFEAAEAKMWVPEALHFRDVLVDDETAWHPGRF
jgi:hypothetical protein